MKPNATIRVTRLGYVWACIRGAEVVATFTDRNTAHGYARRLMEGSL